jgi:hypothetical protein
MFGTVISALNATPVEVTNDNIGGVSALCGEFGFNFSSPLFRWSREPVQRQFTQIGSLRALWASTKTSLGKLHSKVSALQRNLSSLRNATNEPAPRTVVGHVSKAVDRVGGRLEAFQCS